MNINEISKINLRFKVEIMFVKLIRNGKNKKRKNHLKIVY